MAFTSRGGERRAAARVCERGRDSLIEEAVNLIDVTGVARGDEVSTELERAQLADHLHLLMTHRAHHTCRVWRLPRGGGFALPALALV